MAEELLDIVDEENNLTGEVKPRSVVHGNGLWHRVAHTHVINPDGMLLVHKRSLFKDLSPGKWDFGSGGHVASGENPEPTALKELKEELGLAVFMSNLFERKFHKESFGGCSAFIKRYTYLYDGDISKLSFDDGEIEEVKWMFFDDIVGQMKRKPQNWAGPIDAFIRSTEGIINLK